MASTIPGHDDTRPCSPNDNRIMLRILLAEAVRYHRARNPHVTSEDWKALLDQIEFAWVHSAACPVEERYIKLKYRLTTLFLWDRDSALHRDLADPPMFKIEAMGSAQQRRLEELPPGKLFHPTPVMA